MGGKCVKLTHSFEGFATSFLCSKQFSLLVSKDTAWSKVSYLTSRGPMCQCDFGMYTWPHLYPSSPTIATYKYHALCTTSPTNPLQHFSTKGSRVTTFTFYSLLYILSLDRFYKLLYCFSLSPFQGASI